CRRVGLGANPDDTPPEVGPPHLLHLPLVEEQFYLAHHRTEQLSHLGGVGVPDRLAELSEHFPGGADHRFNVERDQGSSGLVQFGGQAVALLLPLPDLGPELRQEVLVDERYPLHTLVDFLFQGGEALLEAGGLAGNRLADLLFLLAGPPPEFLDHHRVGGHCFQFSYDTVQNAALHHRVAVASDRTRSLVTGAPIEPSAIPEAAHHPPAAIRTDK